MSQAIRAHFKHLYRSGQEETFLLDVDIDLPGQGITAIFGPSGSGKTTLLRCIAGLQNVENGVLHVN